MTVEEVETFIREALPDAEIEAQDLRGDGEHFEVRVASALFGGRSRLDRHRMVFAALQGRVGSTIQTFSLTTIVKGVGGC